MKPLTFLLCLVLSIIFIACGTKVQKHTPGASDQYCTYLVKSVDKCVSKACYKVGDTICLYCGEDNPNHTCGAKGHEMSIELVPSGDKYSIDGMGEAPTCDKCATKDTAMLFEKKK